MRTLFELLAVAALCCLWIKQEALWAMIEQHKRDDHGQETEG